MADSALATARAVLKLGSATEPVKVEPLAPLPGPTAPAATTDPAPYSPPPPPR